MVRWKSDASQSGSNADRKGAQAHHHYAGGHIVVSQDSDTNYIGTFTPKNGSAKGVRIGRLSDTQTQTLQADASKAVAIEKPAPDVPASCAAFSGKWTGEWRNFGLGQRWLWVIKIDSSCVATYYYGTQQNPKTFQQAQIKGERLVWPCTRANCIASLKGDSLQVDYTPDVEGHNWIALKRIP